MANRDNFNKQTIEVLSKRVGLICSNPDCRVNTMGPHTEKEKVASIGVAAHITAASPGGPRYDATLSSADRKAIENGIWLCQTCSTIIDKDPDRYSVELLKSWKTEAEEEALEKLNKKSTETTRPRPYLEAELVWRESINSPRGISYRNKEVFDGPIPVGKLIKIFGISWKYELRLYNNSSVPLYNVKVYRSKDEWRFSSRSIRKIAKVNNIQPLDLMTIILERNSVFVGNGEESEKEYRKGRYEYFPLSFIVEYQSEDRNTYYTRCYTNETGELLNEFVNVIPEGYLGF